jgi:hypothetical protein
MVLMNVLRKNGLEENGIRVIGMWKRLGKVISRDGGDEGIKDIVDNIGRNIFRYASGMNKYKYSVDKSDLECDLERVGFCIKRAMVCYKEKDYKKFSNYLTEIDRVVADNVEKIYLGKRAETEAEKTYIEKIADKIIDEMLNISINDNRIKIGSFEKEFKTAESMRDYVYKYGMEINRNETDIMELVKNIDVDKFDKSGGMEISLEDSVLVLVEELGKEGSNEIVGEILDRVINVDNVDKDKCERFKEKFNINGSVEDVGVVYNIYRESIKKIGFRKTIEIFNKVFKRGELEGEMVMMNEVNRDVAVVDETGKVKIKDKDTGQDEREEVYKSKEEAITNLYQRGYK